MDRAEKKDAILGVIESRVDSSDVDGTPEGLAEEILNRLEGTTGTMRVKIMPDLTVEQQQRVAELIERKGHLEYVCLMMLKRLAEALPLERLIPMLRQLGYEQEYCDELKEEFFGDPEQDGGCPSAEGFSIPTLIGEWDETTNNMLAAFAGRDS